MATGQPSDRSEQLRAFGLGSEDLSVWRDTGLPDDSFDDWLIDRTAWRDSGLPDDSFDDWLNDRTARRPSGHRARAVYGAEDVHDFARRAISARPTCVMYRSFERTAPQTSPIFSKYAKID